MTSTQDEQLRIEFEAFLDSHPNPDVANHELLRRVLASLPAPDTAGIPVWDTDLLGPKPFDAERFRLEKMAATGVDNLDPTTWPQAPATGERDDLRDAREVVAKWRIGYGEAIRAGEAWQEMVEAVRMGIAFARDAEETNK